MTTKKRKPEVMTSRLRRARTLNEPVRITRDSCGADALDGFVQAVGPKWTVIAVVGENRELDGHSCVRTQEIARVRSYPYRRFTTRLLEGRGQWPPPAPLTEVDLRHTGTLLRALADHSPVLTVFTERDDPDMCSIGVPVRWGRRTVWLDEVDPDATWDDTISKWHYTDITRIDVGGRYEVNLVEAAGPAPRAVTRAR